MADNVVDILLRARMEAGDVASGVGSIQKALNGLTLPKNISGDLDKQFAKLTPLIKDYQKQLDKGFKTPKDLKNLELLKEKIADSFGSIQSSLQQLNGQEIRFKTDTESIAKMEKQLDGLQAKLQDKLSNIYKKGQDKDVITSGIKGITQALNSTFASGNFKFPALRELTSGLQQAFKAENFVQFNQQLDLIKSKLSGLSENNKIDIAKTLNESLNLNKTVTDVQSAQKVFDDFFNKITVNRTSANGIDRLNVQIKDLQASIAQTKIDSLARGADALGSASGNIDQMAQSILNVGDNASQAAGSVLSMQQQVDQLKTSTQYFFSLRNMINLFKRGIREAYDAVKELDAAMTETAVVVPEWNVGDMWAKLPEYTKNANALGATVTDMYKATTLYYQQGLRGNEVMDIAAETMKMARLGGLEAADATDKMTAALRGFNMEINATSAQRVNDVYSNLAANTASNTEELGTAMQRTASIAASAGMSFEGTAAFLAQAIETTREPAENLGTAMKTIVARFTELKKNPLEITEVDGEEVSYNKVDAALQSIGVSLKDANGQFRDLDQVFLDISQRWDGLTQTQQRYVATQAAGSRQQSRFIAMMSNYQRTTELMAYANDSAGASQEQFEKTMESLEAKVNKLQNAWKEFTMGIANNNIIKGAVDGLTNLISGVNKLIDTLSLGSGTIKSVLSLFTAFVGLKMGGRLVNSLIGGLGGLVDPTSSFGAGFRGGAISSRSSGNPALASQIYTPIVQALHELKGTVAANTGKNVTASTAQQARSIAFSDSRQGLNLLRKQGNFKAADVTKQLTGLPADLQKQLAFNFKGVIGATFRGVLKKQGLSKEATQAVTKVLRRSISHGDLSVNDAINAAANKNSITQILSNPSINKDGIYNSQIKQLYSPSKQLARPDHKIKFIDKNHTAKANARPVKPTKVNLRDKQAGAKARQRIRQQNQHRQETMLGADTQMTKTEQLTGAIGNFGAGIQSVGMALNGFASVLQQSANPAISAFGSGLSMLGSTLTGVGMGISGMSGAFQGMTDGIMGLTGASNAAATAMTGIIGIVGALIAVAVVYEHMRKKQIKEDAEKVTEDYNTKSKEASTNISNLQSWESELNRLKKGVDENGNNINLEASDYQQYLQIVDDIAEMNPKIVKGYNEQGHAIIDNNSGLQETLKLQKQLQQEALNNYISDESFEKVVKARDLNKIQRKIDKTTGEQLNLAQESNTTSALSRGRKAAKRTSQKTASTETMFAPQSEMINNAQKMVKVLKEAKFTNEDFDQFGVDLNAIENGSLEAATVFGKNLDKIKTMASAKFTELGDKISEDSVKSFDKAFSGYSTASDNLEEIISPTYDLLSKRFSQTSAFKDIPDELREYFNEPLKSIASDANLSWEDMLSNATTAANGFTNLLNNGEYTEAVQAIEDAQDKFGKDLDEDAYTDAVDNACDKLKTLRNGLDETNASERALAEYIDNYVAKSTSWLEDGVTDLSDAFNTFSDEISAAEGALESFKKVEEGSNYGTAAEGLKTIYDTVMEQGENGAVNKHAAGKGDQTYWAAAEAIVGRENLANADKDDADRMMKALAPMLEGGAKGNNEFIKWMGQHKTGLQKLAQKSEGLEVDENGYITKLNTDLDPEVFSKVASELKMSEDSLTAMLNNARQFSDIDFSSLENVRKNLATSEGAIEGIDSTATKAGNRIYMKEDQLRAEMAQAGITTIKDQNEYLKKLQKQQNVYALAGAEDIKKKTFDNMGITDIQSLVETFAKTGQYDKSEIEAYANKFAELNGINNENFDEIYDDVAASMDPMVSEQQTANQYLAEIAAAISPETVNEKGELENSAYQKDKEWLWGEKGQDTAYQYFATGKGTDKEPISTDQFYAIKEELNKFVSEGQGYISLLNSKKDATTDETVKAAIQKEIDNYQMLIDSATDYISKGTEAFNQNGQSLVDSINQKYGNILGQNTDFSTYSAEQQQAFANVFGNIGQNITTELIQDLQSLGVDIQAAIDSGLVVDTNGVYAAYKEAGGEVTDAATDGAEDGSSSTDTSGVETNAENSGQTVVDAATSGVVDGSTPTSEQTSGAQTAGTEAGTNIIEQYANGVFNTPYPLGEPQAPAPASTPTPAPTPATQPVPQNNTPYTIQVDSSQVDTATTKVNNLTALVNTGGTYTINTTGIGKINKAAKAAKTLTKNSGEKNVSVSADVSGTNKVDKFNTAVKTANKLKSKTIKLKADVSGTQATSDLLRVANSFRNLKDKTITNKTINWTVTKKTKEDDYRGGLVTGFGAIYRAKGGSIFQKKGTDTVPAMLTPGEYVQKRDAVEYFGVDFMQKLNHKDLVGALKSFGSAAKGSRAHGSLGPLGHGGLTLTGEEGYEVAWIPSQNRSMILGANGPEMLDLPADTIIWDHKHSQNIISKNDIPGGSAAIGAGSMQAPEKEGTFSWKTVNEKTGKPTKTTPKTTKKEKKKPSKSKNDDKKVAKGLKLIVEKGGKLSLWWENQTRKVDAIFRKVDQTQKKIDKLLDKSTATLNSTSNLFKNIDKYAKELNIAEKLSKQSETKATKQLKALDTGNSRTSISYDVKQYKFSKKTKKKKSYKNAKKDYLNAKADLAEAKKKNKSAAVQKKAQKKLAKAQKKLQKLGKGSKKTKKTKVKLSRFITVDPETGAYIVDQKEINKVAKKNKSKAKAISDAAYKKIDDKNQKLATAEDNRQKVQDARDELRQKIYDTFFGWENELTKILELTNKIADAEAKINRFKGAQELQTAMLSSGLQQATADFAEETVGLFGLQVTQMTEAIKQRSLAIGKQREKISKLINIDDERALVDNLTKRGAAMEVAAKREKKYNQAKKKEDAAVKKASKANNKLATTKDNLARKKLLRKEGRTQKTEKKKINDKTALIKQLKAEKKKAKTDKEKKKIQKKIEKAQKSKKVAKLNLKALQTTKKDLSRDKKAASKANKTAEKASKDRIAAEESFNAITKKLQDLGLKADQYTAADIEINAARLAQEQTKLAELQKAQKYITISQNGDGTLSFEFNEAQLEADKEQGQITDAMAKSITDYYKSMKDASDELHSLYDDQLSALTEMYSLVVDLKEQYADYADELMDALEKTQQDEIDKLSTLNDSLTKHLKDLLDEVKRRLEERRQQEDNAQTETDIAKKQQRLAVLRADTSGGHASEIKQLEQEIAEAQQNYGRTLEDQTLQRLEDQADKAEKQRDKQIELLQTILDLQRSGNNKEQVNSLLERLRSTDEETQKQAIAEATELLKNNQDFENQNSARQDAIMAGINSTIHGLMTLPANISVAEAQTFAIQNDVALIRKAIEDLTGPIIKIGEATRLLEEGTTVKGLKEQGFDWETIVAALRNLGKTDQEIAQALITEGQTGKQVQNLTGASVQDIAKGNTAAGGSGANLGGVKGNIDTNGKKSGGVKSAHVNASGTKMVGNKGSTLYYQDFNAETGKTSGAVTKKTVDKITEANAKANPIETRQAIEYAITHQKAGTKINKNLGAIAKALGINRNKYQITTDKGNKTWATLSDKGHIYWNTKDKGIKKWNTDTGKVSTYKTHAELNKLKETARKALKSSSIWREYKAWFDAHNKSYAQGGVANFTGPAWLDGTRAKPEAVLSATDTKNFIALKDILSDVMGHITDNNTTTYGDSTYEININVDHLNNDYDVDKVAKRVEKIITEDASYRNVTMVRKFR